MNRRIVHSNRSRSTRRVRRTLAARRRWSRVAAVVGAVGAAMVVSSVFFVQVGGAVGSATANPNTGLTDGATVTVSWTGLAPSFSPIIEQCNASPTNPVTDCDFLTLVVSDSDSSGAGSDTFNVFAGDGPSHLFACDDQHACTIRVADNPNDITTGALGSLTFSTVATTTSSTASTTTTTNPTTTTTTSSSSSTTSTTTAGGSTTSSTSSTTSPEDTTSTTGSVTVLGSDASNTGGGGGDGLVLAFTGTALHLPTTLIIGAVLFVIGLGLRRFALAPE